MVSSLAANGDPDLLFVQETSLIRECPFGLEGCPNVRHGAAVEIPSLRLRFPGSPWSPWTLSASYRAGRCLQVESGFPGSIQNSCCMEWTSENMKWRAWQGSYESSCLRMLWCFCFVQSSEKGFRWSEDKSRKHLQCVLYQFQNLRNGWTWNDEVLAIHIDYAVLNSSERFLVWKNMINKYIQQLYQRDYI